MPNDAFLEDMDPEDQAYFESSKNEPAEEVAEVVETPVPDAPAVAEPEAKTDEKAAEKPAETEDKVTEGKTVPLAVLLQERKDFQAKLDAEAEKRAKLDGRLDEINKRLAPEKPAEAEFEDPIAKLDRLEREGKERDARDQQRTQYETFARTVMADEQKFTEANADYVQAMNFMRGVRDRELSLVGITDPARRIEIINQEAHALASNALQANQSPASRLYELAKLRGYAVPVPPAPETAATPAPAVDPTAKIEALQKSVAASTSLSGAAGTTRQELSLEDLANMSDEDFDKYDLKTIAKLHS